MTDIRARLPGNFNIRAQTLQTLQRSAVTDLAGGCLGLVDVLRWGEVRLRGEIMELELEVALRGELEVAPDLMLPEDACLSWVARVPRGICLGEVEAGEEEVLGLDPATIMMMTMIMIIFKEKTVRSIVYVL